MKKEAIKNCKNCEQPFNEVYEYCPHCGQKDKDELTLGLLFYNTVANYFSFDARFFKSFFPLLFRPGYLAAKFIEGKRLLYLHPAQLYLFISIVFFFLYSFNVRKQVTELDNNLAKTLKSNKVSDTLTNNKVKDSVYFAAIEAKRVTDSIKREEVRKALKDNAHLTGMNETQIDSIVNTEDFNNSGFINFKFSESKVDSLIAVDASNEKIYKAMGMEDSDSAFIKRLYAQTLKFYKSRKGGSILQAFYDTIPIAMFFVLPLFALILKLFYRKTGRYSHHLVFSFYFFAFIFTVFSIIVGVNLITDIPDWIDAIIFFSVFIYLIVAIKRFYQKSWLNSIVKGSLTTLTFLPVVIIAMIGVLVFAFTFY
ncbi:DUF3667 domain-containing protein [Lacinutrix salivirga]